MNDFRATFLPYCIKKQIDGRYAILNRRYKPIGFNTTSHINYGDYPILVNIEGLTSAIIKKLSWEGSEDTECIYLYNDGTNPIVNTENMTSYMKRLAILAKLTISPQP